MIVANDIWVAFQQPVLEGLSVQLTGGQLVGLIGPNGSGKTTLLRIMRNRLQPDRGGVFFDGQPIQSYSRSALARRMGYVLQDHTVGFRLTVMEYVLQARFAYSNGFGFEQVRDIEVAERALRMTKTMNFCNRRIDELSGGERQRVVLARALACEPEVVFLDEPTANMDLAYQLEMLTLIKRLTLEKGMLSVFVTHELNLATEFADRMLLLRHGRLVADGAPGEVVTGENLRELFGCDFLIDTNPMSGAPRVSLTPMTPD